MRGFPYNGAGASGEKLRARVLGQELRDKCSELGFWDEGLGLGFWGRRFTAVLFQFHYNYD